MATSVEVTLLGVTFSSAGEICLVPTHISVSTDNFLMLKLVSTPDGRIFMAGADGPLHEFTYETHPQARLLDILSGRPAKRARKIIHSSSLVKFIPASVRTLFAKKDELVDITVDPSRRTLYTLSQSGALAVYDISDVSSARFVGAVDVSRVAKYGLIHGTGGSQRIRLHTCSNGNVVVLSPCHCGYLIWRANLLLHGVGV